MIISKFSVLEVKHIAYLQHAELNYDDYRYFVTSDWYDLWHNTY